MIGSIEFAFTGRVGVDPELRTSQADKPWCRFSVAVGDGDNVQWVQVAAFREKAEELAGTLHKGDRCYCEGTIKLNEWGRPGSRTDIYCAPFEALLSVCRCCRRMISRPASEDRSGSRRASRLTRSARLL